MLDYSSRIEKTAISSSDGAIHDEVLDAKEMRDTLTSILLGLRLDGVEYGRCVMRAPWAVSFPAQRSARFHFVASGGCWLRVPADQRTGGEWIRLNPGDAVLLPRGAFHILASSPQASIVDAASAGPAAGACELPPVDIGTLPRVPVADNIYLVNQTSQTSQTSKVMGQPPAVNEAAVLDVAPPDVIFCGSLRFNLDPLHPLMTMMPEVMLASDLAQRDPTVPALLQAMEREVALDRIGACGILARLADVLAASIIRTWVECGCNDATGWVAAVRCPKVGKVIAAIHATPERDWTVPLLAEVMGVSRSTFAEAFTRVMGESPAKYVAKVKMFQARLWIANEGMRIAVAAERLGYDSEASFSRAFKRIIGHAPSLARAG